MSIFLNLIQSRLATLIDSVLVKLNFHPERKVMGLKHSNMRQYLVVGSGRKSHLVRVIAFESL